MSASEHEFHRLENKSFINFIRVMLVLFLVMALLPLTSHASEPSEKYVLTVIWDYKVRAGVAAFQEFESEKSCRFVARKIKKYLLDSGLTEPFISCDPK